MPHLIALPENFPRIVCLCGSTRFRREYEQIFREYEHAGHICLTVPCFKDDPCCKTDEARARLDQLHLHKIDLADSIFVINVGGYVGESTAREIEHARRAGKTVCFFEPVER